ncbi:MFS transporter [Entomomonas asaccharolytica]|uniref:MFS transporter n=1 Tax=Entomomonas asaccharolytica TaxID=2785331 RepID=A0A974NF76_9GAMM|nr:MFS transporter [Entomomonas asaccharolytica]QQP85676.1 MFS transporter [Entomomonas asaccharolytica]
MQKTISKNKLLTIAGLGWLFDAMDVGLLSFVLAALAKDWQLSATTIAWIGSVNSIGMAVGAFLFGLLADRFGRRFIFIFTLLLFSIASGLTAFTTGLTLFLILRFIIGMGLGGELPVASTLVAESVQPHERGRIVVLLESFWAFGWIIAALIGYFVITDYGWRVAMLLSALPAFYAVYLRLNLPDSPRYTAQTVKPSITRNIKMIWSAEYKKATLMLWILWFCVVFSYYGMFLWLPSVVILKGFDLVKSFEYVLIMTLAQLPGYFTAAWLIEKVGRKFVLVTYLTGTAIAAYFFGIADTAMQLVMAGMFLSFFNLGAWGALYAYTPEQYPTLARATGAGMAAGIGRIGGILGPLMVGYMVSYQFSPSVIFNIFCLVIAIGVMAVLVLGKETKQTELT